MQVVKPREEYVMVIDADCILRKPFLPEELHLELGEHPRYPVEPYSGKVPAPTMTGTRLALSLPQHDVRVPTDLLV